MPKIELWEKTGKGALKILHNIKRPVEVVALEDAQGSLFPIYEGNNEVPAGIYKIVAIRPYAKVDQDVFCRQEQMLVEAWDDDEVVYIVNVGEFLGGYYAYKGDAWEKYAGSNASKLERPVGWIASSAQRVILDANKCMG